MVKKTKKTMFGFYLLVSIAIVSGAGLTAVVMDLFAVPPLIIGVDDTPGDMTDNDFPSGDGVLGDPQDSGAWEKQLFKAYESLYISDNGYIISNHVPVPWCPNACIGCADTVTSEAVARAALYASQSGDKVTFDKMVNFYHITMAHPETGHMQWQLNPDGSSGACGGQNTAIDSELIFIGALEKAMDKWGSNAQTSLGYSYVQTQEKVSNSIKGAVIDTKYGKTLAMCGYPSGDGVAPCENKVFLGYLQLDNLDVMAELDPYWIEVRDGTKEVLKAGTTTEGVYSTYYSDDDRFAYEMADIHPNWMLKSLLTSDHLDTQAVANDFYIEARDIFLNNRENGGSEICQEFSPIFGCKLSNPDLRVYGHWLEIASYQSLITTDARDIDFMNELISYIKAKVDATKGADGIPSNDNFGNIVVLEALADAREVGGVVG